MKKFNKYYYVVLSCITAIVILYSLIILDVHKKINTTIDLSQNWTITVDGKSFKDNFKYNSVYKTGSNKFITLEKTFYLPDDYKNKPIVIKFDTVSSAYKLYINNCYVGKSGNFPPKFFNGVSNINYYFIPSKILNYDSKNLIHIKYYCSYESGFKSIPAILKEPYANKLFNVQRFVDYTYYAVLCSILFCISVVFAYIYNKSKTYKYMKYFSLITMLLAIYFQRYTLNTTPLNYLVYEKLLYTCLFTALCITPLFLREYFSLMQSKIDKIIIIVQLVFVAFTWFIVNLNIYMKIAMSFSIIFLGAYQLYYIYICYIAHRANKSQSLKLLFLFIFTFISGLVDDAVVKIINPYPFIIPIMLRSFAILILVFIITFSLGERIVNLQKEKLKQSMRLKSTNFILQKIIKENKNLYAKTITDEMTGLYNRFYLKQIYNNEQGLMSDKTMLAILFMDIDNFREFNNKYGHDTGDFIIKKFSEEIKKILKDDEIFARFGGDEFCILIYTKNKDRHIELAKGIISTFTNKVFNYKDKTLKINCSIGISIVDDYTPFEDALKKADLAMYDSKNKGKNRFSIS